MERHRKLGLTQIVAGIGILVFAVLLVGLTEGPDDSPDWVSIITAAAGAVLVITGLFTMTRKRMPGDGHLS